jgi:hypothetical protein
MLNLPKCGGWLDLDVGKMMPSLGVVGNCWFDVWRNRIDLSIRVGSSRDSKQEKARF